MSLLTVVILKNSHTLAGNILHLSLKNNPSPNLKGFQYQIWTSVKRSGKYSYQVRQILVLFCELIALISG